MELSVVIARKAHLHAASPVAKESGTKDTTADRAQKLFGQFGARFEQRLGLSRVERSGRIWALLSA